MKSTKIILALGSNLTFEGIDSVNLLNLAQLELERAGLNIVAASSIYASEAWPKGNGAPVFHNMVIFAQSEIEDPKLLLSLLHRIEEKFGRNRDKEEHWGSRTLDIDIIDFDGMILNEFDFDNSPILPHPRAMTRDFVLVPLLEICPNWTHPETGITAEAYLQTINANSQLQTNMYVVNG